MAPNLFLALKAVLQPLGWFKHRDSCRRADLALTQFRNEPVPGIYEHVPGCGWFLIATKPSASAAVNTITMVTPPKPVVYSKVLKRFLFEHEFVDRTCRGRIQGQPKWNGQSGFFRLDDGITWVNCWDHAGGFQKGPWTRYYWDEDGQKFRPMRIGDMRRGQNSEECNARRTAKPRNPSGASSMTTSGTPSLDDKREPYSDGSTRNNSTCESLASGSQNRTKTNSRILMDGNGNLNIERVSIRSSDVTSNPRSPRPSLRVHTESLASRTTSRTQSMIPEQTNIRQDSTHQ